jgi:hypothetical protein
MKSEVRMVKSEIRETVDWSNIFHFSDFNLHHPTMVAESGQNETLVPLNCKQLRKGYQGQRGKSAAFPWARQTSFSQGNGSCSSRDGKREMVKREVRKVKTALSICFGAFQLSDFTLHSLLGGLGGKSEVRMVKGEVRETVGWSNLFHFSDFNLHSLLGGLCYGG